METKERILLGATELFFQVGIKSTTMDDIAAKLSVSKKTIYQHFPDKNALVEQVTLQILERDMQMIDQLEKMSKNAVEHIIFISFYIRNMMRQMQPSLIFDLHKYHSKAFQHYRQFKMEKMLSHLKQNIAWGKKEGHYRKEINEEILARTRLGCFDIVGNSELFPPQVFDYAAVHIEMFDHFIHGLFTQEGHRYFDDLMKEHDNYNQLTQSIIQKIQAHV